MEEKEEKFTVECAVCRQHYDNWWRSTPCCGSIAYLIGKDGETTRKAGLYSSVGVVLLDFGKDE